MSKPEAKIFENKAAVAKSIAELIKDLSNTGKIVNIALSGGSTPRILFELLADQYQALPWDHIHLYWGDERCVAPDDDQSNYKMTRETLLDKVKIPEGNIHRVEGERDPSTEAKRYGTLISSLDKNEKFPPFDLILLGMGDDGHTASIFPHEIELLESNELCKVATHPVSGQKRITFTGGLIRAAKEVAFLVTGEGKAERIREIFNNEKIADKYPAYHISHNENNVKWYLDKEAAKHL